MREQKDYYDVYFSGDRLVPGEILKIEHSLSFREDRADISPLTEKSMDELEALRAAHVEAEREIYEKLLRTVTEWEARAAETLLIDKAIQYLKTPAVAHSANRWVESDGYHSVSNAVYKMSYYVYEDTRYDRETQRHIPIAWYLTWDMYLLAPGWSHSVIGYQIAGQNRKCFTDKDAMDRYMQGRIKAYSHYFTELSPPIPKMHANKFCVNGLLLPGYTLAADG